MEFDRQRGALDLRYALAQPPELWSATVKCLSLAALALVLAGARARDRARQDRDEAARVALSRHALVAPCARPVIPGVRDDVDLQRLSVDGRRRAVFDGTRHHVRHGRDFRCAALGPVEERGFAAHRSARARTRMVRLRRQAVSPHDHGAGHPAHRGGRARRSRTRIPAARRGRPGGATARAAMRRSHGSRPGRPLCERLRHIRRPGLPHHLRRPLVRYRRRQRRAAAKNRRLAPRLSMAARRASPTGLSRAGGPAIAADSTDHHPLRDRAACSA